MKSEIKVPSMGESITEATVGAILKPTGSKVSVDDEVLELETDKVNQVLYAPQAGIIHINVQPEERVVIGQVVGYVESDSHVSQSPEEQKKETPPPKEIAEVKPKEAANSQELAKPRERAATQVSTSEPPKVTQQQAGEKQLGQKPVRITRESAISDLLVEEKSVSQELPKALSVGTTAIHDSQTRVETRRKMSKIRKVIAARLVEAQKQTAMLTTFNEVDMSQIMLLRDRYKESFAKEHGIKLGFMSFFVKACVSALQVYQDINSYIEGDEIVHREYYDIGIAVGTDRGLVVPVVRNCDKLSFAGIETAIEQFAKKAREGGLSVDDLQGGGFTITNGGVYGSLLSTPILNMPQSGILGMHKISKRAVVVDDQIVIRPMMYLALSYDHRIVDGKEAVSFLVHVKNMLEDPTRLLLEV